MTVATRVDLASGTFIADLSPWVRWVFLAPGAFFFPAILLVINHIYYSHFGGELNLIFTIWYGLLYGTCIPLVGAWWAPKHQRQVALLLMSIVLGLCVFFLLIGHPFYYTGFVAVMVASIAVAAITTTISLVRA
jgi:hypothetical protein